jgi:hypothetical protein
MKALITIFACVMLCACTDTWDEFDAHHPPEEQSIELEEQEIPPWVGISLEIGHLTASEEFLPTDPDVPVPLHSGWTFRQIAARLDVPDGVAPEFLRVVYTSDRIEWIGTNVMGQTFTFLTEDECRATGTQCDDVIPGESISGYFNSGKAGMMSIANVHCSHVGIPYELTVTAFVIDIAYPVAERISDEAYITMN